ncbi:PRELI domain-containing protein 2-like [Daphnia pulex]|uniref:PRELI domain-containing protein 2-like n=1 Tax=Daphnia pulex TaxID=6669 RepID=UPI001EDD78B5|nr:PRELI domain-containing protein 2-like [Daphnia pulex]XP_046653236.1 PRELI domain-containing protein 2-like [Daphnia pulicaria]
MGKFTFQHIYEFPWELVTHTHLTKYPTEKEKNIVGTQITDAKKGPGNQIYLKIVVTCLNVLPSVFRKLKVLDVPNILYEEECWIDTKKRFAQLKSRPVGFQNYAVLTESSTFSQASENPNWTLFTQEGVIEMIGFGRMSWLIEVFATKFLTRGAKRNVSIMEELMKERLAAFKLLAQ